MDLKILKVLFCLLIPTTFIDCYCNNGFMDEDLLRLKAAQIPNKGPLSNQTLSLENEDSRWLFPQLKFTCQSGKLLEATVGIDIRGFNNRYPSLELWRQTNSDDPYHYNKVTCGYTVHLTSSNSTTNSVFTIKFPNPLVVESTYVLGIYQPLNNDSTIRFFYDNNSSSTAYRLINPDDGTADINDNTSTIPIPDVHPLVHFVSEPSSCSEGFIDLDVLKSKTSLITNVIRLFDHQRIFPNISFTCEGYVYKWIIGGLNVSGVDYPKLRIGREDELSLREAITLVPSKAINTGPNVYEYHHDPPLYVREGDVLIMAHFGYGDVNDIVFYQEVSGPDNYHLTGITFGKVEENIFPLISVVVGEDSVNTMNETQTPITSSLMQSVTASSETNQLVQSAFERYVIALMGAIIGTLGVMLLVTLTLVTFLFLHIRRKREFTNILTTANRRAKLLNPIVVIDINSNEPGKFNNGRTDTLNASFRGKKLIIRNAKDMIGKLEETDNRDEITIEARISLSDGDTDAFSDSLVLNLLKENEESYSKPSDDIEVLWKQLAHKKIRRQEIQIIDQFKFGQFGKTAEAVWKSSNGTSIVSTKIQDNDVYYKDRLCFLQEAVTIIQFHHTNIIKLHGIVTDEEASLMVYELLPTENLKSFLQKMNLSLSDSEAIKRLLMSFCSQIASGMEYLHKKEYIHGNLTSMNIQLSKGNICKIDLFTNQSTNELSNDVNIMSQWITAPEVVKGGLAVKASDVWSYGGVMYDIWNLAKMTPNNLIIREESMENHFQMPIGCPKAIYHLMIDCRDLDISKRPSFSYLNARCDFSLLHV